MPVRALERKTVRKVWGRHDLPQAFGSVRSDEEPVGEVWYDLSGEPGLDLMVKFLFTSEELSIQVHPDDEGARRLGYPHGKDEAWIVLGAEPGAVVGLGLRESVTPKKLRAAALDGSILRLIDWRSVKAGDVFHVPAGTVHALGPGLVVAEIQRNVDCTLRLYDYGRPRELHLDDAVREANCSILGPTEGPVRLGPGRECLVEGESFRIERWRGPAQIPLAGERPVWIVPLAGRCLAGPEPLGLSQVALSRGETLLEVPEGCEVLLACAGRELEMGSKEMAAPAMRLRA